MDSDDDYSDADGSGSEQQDEDALRKKAIS